tara:strand:- start:105 stop:362 length:258 start_codon:yes stop_codon:yes gene_type:complete
MGLSSKQKKVFDELSAEAKKRLIKMSWSDKVSFEEIKKVFGLSANQVEKFMLYELGEKDYKRWLKRRVKRFNQKSKKAAILRSID